MNEQPQPVPIDPQQHELTVIELLEMAQASGDGSIEGRGFYLIDEQGLILL